MKVRDIIQEFIPCEVCGNRDINNFHFHIFVHWGSQPYVKCCECEEEYYSTRAREAINKIEQTRRSKMKSIALLGERRYAAMPSNQISGIVEQ